MDGLTHHMAKATYKLCPVLSIEGSYANLLIMASTF